MEKLSADELGMLWHNGTEVIDSEDCLWTCQSGRWKCDGDPYGHSFDSLVALSEHYGPLSWPEGVQ